MFIRAESDASMQGQGLRCIKFGIACHLLNYKKLFIICVRYYEWMSKAVSIMHFIIHHQCFYKVTFLALCSHAIYEFIIIKRKWGDDENNGVTLFYAYIIHERNSSCLRRKGLKPVQFSLVQESNESQGWKLQWQESF